MIMNKISNKGLQDTIVYNVKVIVLMMLFRLSFKEEELSVLGNFTNAQEKCQIVQMHVKTNIVLKWDVQMMLKMCLKMISNYICFKTAHLVQEQLLEILQKEHQVYKILEDYSTPLLLLMLLLGWQDVQKIQNKPKKVISLINCFNVLLSVEKMIVSILLLVSLLLLF